MKWRDVREVTLGGEERAEEVAETPRVLGEEHERTSLDGRSRDGLGYGEQIAEERRVLGEEPPVHAEADVLRDEHDASVLEPELRVVLEVRRRPKVRGWRGWLVPAVGVTRGASAFAYPAIIDCLPRV